MRGGQVFMEALTAHGVAAIFGNPGTTENSLLDRLADYPQIAYYVALHEGVAVGAASFYAQASGTPAVANLHVAPGLGNAIGMIYGAMKANSPLVITAGQQDTRMRLEEPLLSHDLVAMAAPVTKWSVEPRSADEIGPIMQRAFKIADEAPRGPVFVALPVDVMEQQTAIGATRSEPPHSTAASPAAIEAALTLLLECRSPCIIAGDDPARDGAFAALVDFAEALGAPVYHETLRAQLTFPNRHHSYRGRLPLEAAATARLLAAHDLIVLVGGPAFEDVWFDPESALPTGARVLQLEASRSRLGRCFPVDTGLAGDLATNLAALNAALRHAPQAHHGTVNGRNQALLKEQASMEAANRAQLEKLWDVSPMSASRAIHEISRGLPPNTIVVDESITAAQEIGQHIDQQQPGDYFGGRGGGIGQGIAGALGVQVAQPNRRVLALTGDGSAMYSIQALWTAAHHKLPVVFVVLANREYRVLKHNLDIYRQRFDIPSNKPYPHMDLGNPVLGFTEMARGMGVAGELITSADAIAPAIERAFASLEPYLIEVVIAGKP